MNSVPRLPAIERLFGCPLSDVTEVVLQQLVAGSVQESEQLDFKRDWVKDWSELAKDVCAFANARGGVLIYGIEEKDSVAGKLVPFDRPAGEVNLTVAQSLYGWCRPALDVAVPVVESDADSGKVYVLVVVPKSNGAPHARLMSKKAVGDPSAERWLQFPVRWNTGTQYLTEADLAFRYRTRFGSYEARSELLAKLSSFSPDQLQRGARGVSMKFAAVPLEIGEAPIGPRLTDEWESRICSLRTGERSYGCPPNFGVQERQYVRRGIRIRGHDGFIELHSDGSLVASHLLDECSAIGIDRYPNNPVAIEESFVAVRLAALQALSAAFASEAAGCSGELLCRVQFSCVHAGGLPRLIVFVVNGLVGLAPIAGVVPASVLEAETVLPIDLYTGPLSTASFAAPNEMLTEIAHGLGLPFPNVLTADRKLALSQWGDRKSNVKKYAEDQRLPFEL